MAAVLVALGGLSWWASHSSIFRLRELSVRGAVHLSQADVVSLSGIEAATNVLWLDAGATAARIEEHPWVAEASVAREFPGTVLIEVSERAAVGAVRSGPSAFLLVAADGTVLERVGRDPGLPLLDLSQAAGGAKVGRMPRTLVGQAAALSALGPDLRARVVRVVARPDGTLALVLGGGTRVVYGAPAEMETKAAALAEVLGWAEDEGTRLAVIEVRAPRAPAATLP